MCLNKKTGFESIEWGEESTTRISFCIVGLGNGLGDKEEGIGNCWVLSDFRIKNAFLNYKLLNDESFLFSEIISLQNGLKHLINDKLTEPMHISFIEPNFEFKLKPKYDRRKDKEIIYVKQGNEVADISGELIINLITSIEDEWERYIYPLRREEIEILTTYFDEIIPQLETQWANAVR